MSSQYQHAPLFLASVEVEILTGFKLAKRQVQWRYALLSQHPRCGAAIAVGFLLRFAIY